MNLQPQASCTAFWRERERFFEMALHDGFIHFWEPDSPEFQAEPDEWVFCAGGKSWHKERPLEERLQWALEHGHCGRRLVLSDQLTVWVRADGYAFAEAVGEDGRRRAKFFASLDKYVFSRSQSRWTRNLETEARNHTPFFEGGFGEALSELGVPFARGKATRVHLKRGRFDEFKRFADLIFLLDPGWIYEVFSDGKNEGNASVRVLLHLEKPPRLDFGGWDKFPAWNSHPHPRDELWQIWLESFAPVVDEEFHQDEIAKGRRLFEIGFSPILFFKIYEWPYDQPPMTQHERLELYMEMRDWLRARVGLPDARINELLA